MVGLCIVSALATLSTLVSYDSLDVPTTSRGLVEQNYVVPTGIASVVSYHDLKRQKQQEKFSSNKLYSQVGKPKTSSEQFSYRDLKRQQQTKQPSDLALNSNRVSTATIEDDDGSIGNDDEVVTATSESTKAYVEGTWPRETPLYKLFQGPAAPYRNSSQLVFPFSNETDAVCHFQQKGSWDHVPHSMQQLYRCWSWWQANPEKTKVLVIWNIPNDYVRGYLQALQEVFGAVLDRTGKQINVSVNVAAPGTDYQRIPGYEMHHPRDARVLREGIVRHYNLSTPEDALRANGVSTPVLWKPRPPVIGILNRQGGRRIINCREIANALQSHFQGTFSSGDRHDPNVTITTTTIRYKDSFDNQTFLEQATYMSQVDILIAPHGAQLTSITFLPTCGGVLEVFPKGYFVPKFFGSLARATGHEYCSLYTGSVENQTEELQYYMSNLPRREQTRHFNMTVDPQLVIEAGEELVTKWQQCRYQQFQEKRRKSKSARLKQ